MMSQQDDQIHSAKDKVQVGDFAPDFTLPNQSGVPIHLGDLLGKQHLVLYFYPKDNTSLCTEEACAFRDSYEVFQRAGAEVIGISSDVVEAHQQFARTHHLPFILLSDAGGVIRKRYGVSTALGLPGRVTYIIDKSRIVRHIFFSQFTTKRHVEEALETLRLIEEEQM
jgi:peroxiredoxin Q/BCP